MSATWEGVPEELRAVAYAVLRRFHAAQDETFVVAKLRAERLIAAAGIAVEALIQNMGDEADAEIADMVRTIVASQSEMMTMAANAEATAAIGEIAACTAASEFLRGENETWLKLDETLRRLIVTKLRREANEREVAALRYAATVHSSRSLLASAAATMGAGLELMGSGAGSGAIQGMTVGSEAAFHTESEFRTSVIRSLYAASERLAVEGASA